MRKFLTLCGILLSLSVTAQWQLTGSRVRYVNGIGIPTKDTAAGVLADSSQIVIRPADSSLYVKYKRTWRKVGGSELTGSGIQYRPAVWQESTDIGSYNGLLLLTGASSTSNVIFTHSSTQQFGKLGNLSSFSSDFAVGTIGAANNLILHTNDVERVRVTSGGRVLVATSTDNGVDALQIRGSISQTTSTIPVENTVAGVAVLITNTFTDFGVFGTKSNHHLGLITNNSVKASITPGGQFNIGGNYTSTNNTLQVAGNAAIGYTTAAPTNGLIVNGNVGIGTASSNAKLHVYSSGGGMEIYPGGTTVLEFIDRNNTSATVNTEFYTRNGYFAWFNGQYTERMRITSGGNVGIGDAGAANRLTVSHNINGSARISLTNPNTGTSAESFLYAITTGNRYLGILQHGQNKTGTTVGLSNASLSEIQAGGDNSSLLINQGSSTAPIVFATNNAERIRITSGGRILAATTTDNGVDALQVNGSIQANGFDQAYTVRTTTYTAATTDYFIDCTSGTFTVNLFTAVGNTGRILIIKNSGTGTITVDPNGTQTIDGATTQTLSTQWSRVHIISDGANWKIISN
jgi:hypothetical protein